MTYILIAIFSVNSGSFAVSQEFTGHASCEAARQWLYAERERARIGLETAKCFPKGVSI